MNEVIFSCDAFRTGMCSGMIYNLVRKLTEDKEDIIASREKSLASLGIIGGIGGSFPEIPDRTKSASSRNTSHLDCNGCYVPPPPGSNKSIWTVMAAMFPSPR
jgi:hypothetical protein